MIKNKKKTNMTQVNNEMQIDIHKFKVKKKVCIENNMAGVLTQRANRN